MSRVHNMIELSAPSVLMEKETVESRGLRCNYCAGNGWFWGSNDMGESEKHECPFCGGSGKLDAHVTIVWKPNQDKYVK